MDMDWQPSKRKALSLDKNTGGFNEPLSMKRLIQMYLTMAWIRLEYILKVSRAAGVPWLERAGSVAIKLLSEKSSQHKIIFV